MPIKNRLLTKAIRSQLPSLYSTQDQPDPVALVKFFAPWTDWTWYATEFDGHDLFFGLVQGFEEEFGYFSLAEMESITGPAGLKIERDRFFTPEPLSGLRRHKRA